MQIDNLIPIAEYADRIGLTANAIRRRCIRGTLPGVKMGRDWFIPADTPYTDSRVKTGDYKNWRKKPAE
ncbi:MAG: DNA-binding protein [Acidaminococcaceae bacterium]|nr:DNA-binding protein [Acidaminococcaceae bacterium]